MTYLASRGVCCRLLAEFIGFRLPPVRHSESSSGWHRKATGNHHVRTDDLGLSGSAISRSLRSEIGGDQCISIQQCAAHNNLRRMVNSQKLCGDQGRKNAQATAPHYSHRLHSWNGRTTGVAYTYFRLFPRIHAFLCKTQQPRTPTGGADSRSRLSHLARVLTLRETSSE